MIPTIHNLANTLRKLGRFEEAEELLRDGLRQVRIVYGDSHPNTARSLTNLGQLLSMRGRNDDAVPMLSEALRIRSSLLGDTHRDTAMSKLSLGFASLRAGRLVDAEEYLLQAQSVFRQVERPSFAASALSGRASVAFEQGDLEAAETLAREAIGLTHAEFGAEDPERPAHEILLATIVRDRGRLHAARELFAKAVEGVQEPNYRGESWDLASARAGRGSTLLLMGETEAAEAELRSACNEIGKIEAPPHIKADICAWLGAALTALGRHREAEPLLIESYEVARRRGSDLRSTLAARQRLVDLYESWGRPEHAARYR